MTNIMAPYSECSYSTIIYLIHTSNDMANDLLQCHIPKTYLEMKSGWSLSFGLLHYFFKGPGISPGADCGLSSLQHGCMLLQGAQPAPTRRSILEIYKLQHELNHVTS